MIKGGFKPGKYYQHSSGRVIHTLCEVDTFFHYGPSLVAEEETGELMPVGMHEDNTTGYEEVGGWHRSTYESNNLPIPDNPAKDIAKLYGNCDSGEEGCQMTEPIKSKHILTPALRA